MQNKQIKTKSQMIMRIAELSANLASKEQECEELKEQLTILDDEDVVVEITVKQFEEYKKLKAENDELKEFQKLLEEQMKFNKSELELSLSTEIKRSEFLLNEFKKADKQRDNWREKATKLKQTLAEIKEIADSVTDNGSLCIICEVNKNCADCLDEKMQDILQKISDLEV